MYCEPEDAFWVFATLMEHCALEGLYTDFTPIPLPNLSTPTGYPNPSIFVLKGGCVLGLCHAHGALRS